MKLMWHPVIRLPLGADMRPLLTHLDKQQVLHHVTEEEGQQQLWIADEPRIIEVAELTSKWVAGELDLSASSNQKDSINDSLKPNSSHFTEFVRSTASVPVSLITILLGFLGAVAIFADNEQFSYAQPFLFQAISNGYFLSLEETLLSGQYWRLLTPIFLHFTWLHIIFNSLIIWEIGRRIEIAKGSMHLLLVILITGLLSNFAQYFAQANTIFGGLSGVVYGLIGYIGVYQQFITHPVLQFNKAAIAFFIVWLLLIWG